jgi:hypothetical protein
MALVRDSSKATIQKAVKKAAEAFAETVKGSALPPGFFRQIDVA